MSLFEPHTSQSLAFKISREVATAKMDVRSILQGIFITKLVGKGYHIYIYTRQ